MKKLIIGMLLAIVLLLGVNAYTDFFENFGDYAPVIRENYPEISEAVEEASYYVSNFTNMIPTPSQIIALIKNEPLPIDPADVAYNAYIVDSPMLTFYPDENISVKMIDGEYVRLFGVSGKESKSHFVVRFTDKDGESLSQTSMEVDRDKEFDTRIRIPETKNRKLSVEVYAGSRAYGSFTSWVYNYLYITKDENGAWEIMRSPVYPHNKTMFDTDRSVSEALRDTPAIESDEPEIIELACRIIGDAETDYEKVRMIHDWVCDNLWYDLDKVNTNGTAPYAATKVLKSKTAVCLGFATLTASLCRAVDIPCTVVSGYALGVGEDTEWTVDTINTDEQNHAWNEAYVDGRWLIMDPTWDCGNKIEGGEKEEGETSHLYFDANIDFFSSNHKIIDYMKRP